MTCDIRKYLNIASPEYQIVEKLLTIKNKKLTIQARCQKNEF